MPRERILNLQRGIGSYLLPENINRYALPLKMEVDAVTGFALLESAVELVQGNFGKSAVLAFYTVYGVYASKSLVYATS